MFKYAVIGPAGTGNGIIRQCIDCRALAGPDSRACNGFGPGCLGIGSRARRDPEASSPTQPQGSPSLFSTRRWLRA